MNSKKGRIAIACCAFLAIAGFLTYSLIGFSKKGVGQDQVAQTLPDIGAFKVGSALGMERAGFSGRSMVSVFTSLDSKDWFSTSNCLQSSEVQSAMGIFVGILVDQKVEPEFEADLRSGLGYQVIVRSLNGKLLGALAPGFRCSELIDLLTTIQKGFGEEIIKSPIYSALLESSDAVSALKEDGKTEDAIKYVGLLKEFEGPNSLSVLNAENALKQ